MEGEQRQGSFTDALKDVKDYVAFHQKVGMGTALQHLADSLFVNLSNIILLHRDSYLEHVKPGIKPDTLKNLRYAPLGMVYSPTLFWPPQNRIFQNMSLLESLQGLVRAPRSTPVGGVVLDIAGMIHASALLKEIRDSNRGRVDSSPEVETGVVAVVEVSILVFPRHTATKLLNDNYCVVPMHCISQLKWLDQNLDQKVVKDKVFLSSKDLSHQKFAYCQNVVTHVPSAILHRQLQKKGVGPVLSVRKIKVVKGVPCINPLSFAPSVQNVTHVATEVSVGGRLQSFWQVWQKLGSNPRVVSVFRDEYSLPFRERPHLCRFPLIVSKYASPI